MGGRGSRSGAAILVHNPGQDDEEREGAHDVDPGAGLAGVGEEHASAAVDAFDREGDGEGEEQGVMLETRISSRRQVRSTSAMK